MCSINYRPQCIKHTILVQLLLQICPPIMGLFIERKWANKIFSNKSRFNTKTILDAILLLTFLDTPQFILSLRSPQDQLGTPSELERKF